MKLMCMPPVSKRCIVNGENVVTWKFYLEFHLSLEYRKLGILHGVRAGNTGRAERPTNDNDGETQQGVSSMNRQGGVGH